MRLKTHKMQNILLVILLFLSSCSFESKKSFINGFDTFLVKTSDNYKNYDDKAWASSDTTFSHYINQDYEKWKSELTSEESAHINELAGRYHAIKIKAGIKDFKNGVNDLMEQTGAFIKELTSDSTNTKK